jgi:3-dehydroquinate synthase
MNPLILFMESVRVSLGERSYRILIQHGLIQEAGDILFSCNVGSHAVIITNTTVGPLYLPAVKKSLEDALFQVDVIEIPDGEEYKTLAWMKRIYDRLLAYNLDRTSSIIALGGGVIGDMTGFAAATFLRGIPLMHMPTTLLAQVDSSIGGKTGVNLPQGKNMVGAFYQPRLVLIDPAVLKTLDSRELRTGMAEVIKYSVIHDRDFFYFLKDNVNSAYALNDAAVSRIIKTCCTIKAAITEQDEREGGIRAILNFGHTIGHAIETLTSYSRFRHGEAVAMGMAAAARLSAAWGCCPHEAYTGLIALLESAGLPVQIPAFERDSYLAAIQKDKKRARGTIRMVLMKSIGEVFIEEISAEKLASAFQDILHIR